jgi:diguanylate cyclase (GGDEF)-like protein
MGSESPVRAGFASSIDRLRWLLGFVTFSWITLAVIYPRPGGAAYWVSAGLGLALATTAGRLLILRLRPWPDEREMWRPAMLAGLALGIGYVAQTVTRGPVASAGHHAQAWRDLPIAVSILLACGLLYRGLVQWNRFRTAMSDPADWLNGLSAVLAIAGLGNLAIRWSDSPIGRWPWWEQQGWLLALGAAVMALGTVAAVASIAELARDSRVWLLTAAVTAGLAGLIAAPWSQVPAFAPGSPTQICWLIALPLIAFASSQTPQPSTSRPSTTSSTTAGTLVVLVASVVTLALGAASGFTDRRAACYALLAFAGAGVQGTRMMRDLAHLAQSRLEARTDDLTGVANRRELMARLEDAVAQQTDVALLLVDLDRFKDVNDRYGHATGDELLRRVAVLLQQAAPPGALLARIGGDEFALLVRDTTSQSVDVIVTSLVASIRGITKVHDRIVNVGVSIGIAVRDSSTTPAEEVDAGELLRRADVAMYVAKRNQAEFSLYDESLEWQARQRSEHADALRSILTIESADSPHGELVTYYQPQISAATGAVAGVEALVRWQHPTLGLLAPDAFLPLVEEEGLMTRLTGHVLRQAVTQAARWQGADPVRIAVNVSASSLADPELLRLIDEVLISTGFSPELLTIEITETALMRRPEEALEAVRRVSEMGVGISIDDYGTGYSSLTYLNDLAASELKIDRKLTQRVVSSARTAMIVAGTIKLAHHLGLRVVAEGVENQQTHDALREIDCDELQGFYYGTPRPAEVLDDRLRPRELLASKIPRSRDTSGDLATHDQVL